MPHVSEIRTFLVILFGAILAGCDSSPAGPETVAVTGTVTFRGSPVEGANVIFQPLDESDSTLASQAVTDRNGRFELTTHVGAGKFKPGIVPGKYAVTITKLDTASISSTAAPPKNMLPQKYANSNTSGLTANVSSAESNGFNFSLSE
jgi:hypothetical protein